MQDHLPHILAAFSDHAPSLLTRFKRAVLLSRPVLKLVHGREQRVFSNDGRLDAQQVLNLLSTRNTRQTRRHNLVITSEALLLTRNAVGWSRLDAWFSKHAVVSSLAADVRFAGEIWRGAAPNRICISANSGTYKPSARTLSQTRLLLQQVFPHFDIVAEPLRFADGPAAMAKAHP